MKINGCETLSYLLLMTLFTYIRRLNLELYQAADIMSTPVNTLSRCENISKLCNLLLTTTHGGFPVVVESENGSVFNGIVTRFINSFCKSNK